MASPQAAAFLRKAHAELGAVALLIDGGWFDIALARSYYAMFAAATALLAERGEAVRSHGRLQAEIGVHFIRPGLLPREHHQSLSWNEEKRRIADYVPEPGFTEADARESLRRARGFVAAAEGLLPR